jgi:hypothetical protein
VQSATPPVVAVPIPKLRETAHVLALIDPLASSRTKDPAVSPRLSCPLPNGTGGTKVGVLPPKWMGEDAALAGERCLWGLCMGLRLELLDEYSAELRALEESASSKEDDAARERREWLLRVVADLRVGAMTPTVLVAIQKRRRNRDEHA